MSGGGGLIIIRGKNAAGQQGGSPDTATQASVSAAITTLANAGGSSSGSPLYSAWSALTSALAFSQT